MAAPVRRSLLRQIDAGSHDYDAGSLADQSRLDARRLIIDGAFSSGIGAWGELGLALAWLLVLALALALTMRHLLGATAAERPSGDRR